MRLDHAHEFVLVGGTDPIRGEPSHLVLIITALSSCGRSRIKGRLPDVEDTGKHGKGLIADPVD